MLVSIAIHTTSHFTDRIIIELVAIHRSLLPYKVFIISVCKVSETSVPFSCLSQGFMQVSIPEIISSKEFIAVEKVINGEVGYYNTD